MDQNVVHAILVAYHNPAQTKLRWLRDMKPGLEATGLPYLVTVVDNSPDESAELRELFKNNYLYQNGANLQYGPSINLAVARYSSDFLLYCCSRHGKSYDPSWVQDLLNPMIADERVAQTGFLMGSNSPEGVGHALNLPWFAEKYRFDDDKGVRQHIQGGVFAARTAAMLRNPYPPEIPHLSTDHVLTWGLLHDGWECVNVPTIGSVWREIIRDKRNLKYTHDVSED